MDPKEPMYLYINSTGTTRDDGEVVSLDFEFIQLREGSEIKLLGACTSSPSFLKSSAYHGGFQGLFSGYTSCFKSKCWFEYC